MNEIASEPMVVVLGARCPECGASALGWTQRDYDDNVIVKMDFPFRTLASEVRNHHDYTCYRCPAQMLLEVGPDDPELPTFTVPEDVSHDQ